MAYKPVVGAQMASPNVIPMADIMLVLLIIFMVVTPLLTKDIPVDLTPAQNSRDMQDADKDDAIVVAVTRDGRITATTIASSLSASCISRSEEHTSELQSQSNLVCRLLLEKKKTN